MAKKKVIISGTQKSKPPREKKISTADLYHKNMLALLEKRYRLAMRLKNYDEASRIHSEIAKAKREHKHLIHRNEYTKC